MSKILEIIQKLDDLPTDHELETEDLWEALRRIEVIAKDSSPATAPQVLREFVEDVKCAKLDHEEWLDLHLTYRKACNVLGISTSYDS